MALVIEDGTVVAGANSYIDVATAEAYAAARGVDITGLDDYENEVRLYLAMDYLESLNYKGSRTDPDDQALSWPRTGVVVDGRTIGSNTIPTQLKNAQAQLVMEQYKDLSLFASVGAVGPTAPSTEKFVKREKVDVIETEYATPKELGTMDVAVQQVASMPVVDALLRGLLRGFGPLFAYRG